MINLNQRLENQSESKFELRSRYASKHGLYNSIVFIFKHLIALILFGFCLFMIGIIMSGI